MQWMVSGSKTLFLIKNKHCYPDLRATGKYAHDDELHGDCDVSSEK